MTGGERVLSDFVGNFLREDVDAVVFQGAVGVIVAGNYQPCSFAPSLPSGQFINKTFNKNLRVGTCIGFFLQFFSNADIEVNSE